MKLTDNDVILLCLLPGDENKRVLKALIGRVKPEDLNEDQRDVYDMIMAGQDKRRSAADRTEKWRNSSENPVEKLPDSSVNVEEVANVTSQNAENDEKCENVTSQCAEKKERIEEEKTEERTKEERKEEVKKESKDIYITRAREEQVKQIVDYLNVVCGTSFRASTANTRKHINARLTDGFTVEDFQSVIDAKAYEWMNDPKMAQYLRPDTLFGSKFEGYLNAVRSRARPSARDSGAYTEMPESGDLMELMGTRYEKAYTEAPESGDLTELMNRSRGYDGVPF